MCVFILSVILCSCEKDEKDIIFMPAPICNIWNFTEIKKNDIVIPLNDSIRFPNGSPIIISGQPIMVYEGDSLVISKFSTYSSYIPVGYNFPYSAPFYPPDTVFKYLGTTHNGEWSLIFPNKIQVTDSLFDMLPGEIIVLYSTFTDLWLKQTPWEYHFEILD